LENKTLNKLLYTKKWNVHIDGMDENGLSQHGIFNLQCEEQWGQLAIAQRQEIEKEFSALNCYYSEALLSHNFPNASLL
jgi:hypothetical protein